MKTQRLRQHPICTCLALALLPSGLALAADEATELPKVVVSATPADGSSMSGYQATTGHAGGVLSGALLDLPVSLSVVPAELIQNIQAGNATQAMKYTPTVYTNTGGSQITPYYTLRGFTASQTSLWNMAVDGMRSFDIYQPVEDKAQIEILPGASGFLYGISSPAGMINLVSKQAMAEPVQEATLGIVQRQVFAHADLSGPIASAGATGLAYRLNVAASDKGELGVDHQTQARQLISGSLDWALAPDTHVGLNAAHAKRDVDYAQSLMMTTAAIGIPQAPDTSRNWGAPYTFAHDASTRIGALIDSRLSDVLRVRVQARHSEIEREYRLNRQVWQNGNLDYKWRLDSQDAFTTQVDQYAGFLDADFATGPIQHRLTLGATHDDYDKDFDGARSQTFDTVYSGDLYGTPAYPAYAQPKAGNSLAQRTKYDTAILVDRLAWGDQWELMLGANQARIDDSAYSRNVTTGVVTTTPYTSDKTTPAASLSFKPLPGLSTYVSYMEALQQGFTSTTTGNRGETFAPFVGKQREIGAKAVLGGLSITVAWFNIDQANQYTDTTTQVTNQDGRAVHKGWETTLTGKLSSNLTLVGGFTLLDAKIDRAAANVGKTPQGVAEKMARLYVEYDTPWLADLTLTGGASYTGKVPWDAANTLYVSPVTLLDLGLRYRLRAVGKTALLRVGLNNATGKDYWATRSGILYPGEPRTLAMSATVRF